jgi:uncharacterized RDD family membrane protein YckC
MAAPRVATTFAGRRAGFVTRLGAAIVDTAILLLLVQGSAWFIKTWERPLRRLGAPVDLGALVLICAPFITAIYKIAFWYLRGQTPGKWLFGVRVVSLGGGKLGVGQAALRLVGYLVSGIPGYLGFLWILGPQRRGFHDRLAHTEVVYDREWLRGRPQVRGSRRLSAV